MRMWSVFLFLLFTSGASSAATKVDIIDCAAAATRFEIILCANEGAFDLMNAVHQALVFSPDVEATQPIEQEWRAWLGQVESGCMSFEDVGLASSCLYDAAASSTPGELLSRVQALHEPGSDIEGPDECDGCQGGPSIAIAESDVAEPLPDTTKKVSTNLSEEGLTELYTGYLLVSLCSELGLQFEQSDIGAMEIAAKQAEADFDQSQIDRAWKGASAQVDSAKTVFQLSFAQGAEMCEGARLFLGATIANHKQVEPKPF